jgi:hypothetical protein
VNEPCCEPINEEATAHVRLGWSLEKGTLDAPVGFDAFSFSYRDFTGEAFHKSRGHKYGQPYTIGDIIGVYIHIPPRTGPKPAFNGMFIFYCLVELFELIILYRKERILHR